MKTLVILFLFTQLCFGIERGRDILSGTTCDLALGNMTLSTKVMALVNRTCEFWYLLEKNLFRQIAKEKVSGGMFMYNDQMVAVLEIISRVAIERGGNATICETGFNVGHFALLALAVPETKVISFDLLDRKYKHKVIHFIKSKLEMGDRLEVINGDTEVTVPSFVKTNLAGHRCDFIHLSVPQREWIDLNNMKLLARDKSTLIMPTAHTADGEVYGQDGAWTRAISNKGGKAGGSGLVCSSYCYPASSWTSFKMPEGDLKVKEFTHSNVEEKHIYCVGRYCHPNRRDLDS